MIVFDATGSKQVETKKNIFGKTIVENKPNIDTKPTVKEEIK